MLELRPENIITTHTATICINLGKRAPYNRRIDIHYGFSPANADQALFNCVTAMMSES